MRKKENQRRFINKQNNSHFTEGDTLYCIVIYEPMERPWTIYTVIQATVAGGLLQQIHQQNRKTN